MANVTVYNGQLPQAPAAAQADLQADRSLVENFTSGIALPIPRLSIKGREFALHWNGEVVELDKPLDVVLVNSSKANAKAWYAKGWVEESADQPDCWSSDGVRPDASITQPQNPICDGCEWNKFGSGNSPSGKAKACSDSRLLALAFPTQLHEDETNMGTFRLRVPVTSHATLRAYVEYLAKNRFPPNSCVTQLNFDRSVAYQKLTFTFVRPLSDKEYGQSKILREDERTKRTLLAPPEGEEISSTNFAAPTQHAQFGVIKGAPPAGAQVDAKVEQQRPPADVQEANRRAPEEAALAKAQAEHAARGAAIKAGVMAATAKVVEKSVPPAVDGDEIIHLADGRHYSKKQRAFITLPSEPPKDEIIEDETGRLFNVTKGEYVNDGPDEAPEEAQQEEQPETETKVWQPPAEGLTYAPGQKQEPKEEAKQEAAPPKEATPAPAKAKRASKTAEPAAKPATRNLNDIIGKMVQTKGVSSAS